MFCKLRKTSVSSARCFCLDTTHHGRDGTDQYRMEVCGRTVIADRSARSRLLFLYQRFPLSIMLVDDNHINRTVGTKVRRTMFLISSREAHAFSRHQILREFGYRGVVTANDGQEALDKIKAGEFDMVLMDLQMPIMDGRTAMLAIRGLGDKLVQTPYVVALTANADAVSLVSPVQSVDRRKRIGIPALTIVFTSGRAPSILLSRL
jgi:CheY-like chemotaxis protein